MIRILLSTRLGERRWTQADLARATGIRPSTINDLYHEIAERVNLEHLDLICEALGCELSDLIVRGLFLCWNRVDSCRVQNIPGLTVQLMA